MTRYNVNAARIPNHQRKAPSRMSAITFDSYLEMFRDAAGPAIVLSEDALRDAWIEGITAKDAAEWNDECASDALRAAPSEDE